MPTDLGRVKAHRTISEYRHNMISDKEIGTIVEEIRIELLVDVHVKGVRLISNCAAADSFRVISNLSLELVKNVISIS